MTLSNHPAKLQQINTCVLEFIDHTQELEYDYEKGTTDCIRLPNGTLVTENHPLFL